MFICARCNQSFDDSDRAINSKYACCTRCVESEIAIMKENSEKIAPGFILGVLNKAKHAFDRIRG